MGCFNDDSNTVGVAGEPDAGKFGKAKEFDPDFSGPLKKRSCTDIVCCLIFVIFLLGQCVVCYFAYTNGDLHRLIAPIDSKGNLCGVSSKIDRPNLFYFDLSTCGRLSPQTITSQGCPTPKVCVKTCPNITWNSLEAAVNEKRNGGPLEDERMKMICLDDVNPSNGSYKAMSIKDLVQRKLCAPYILPSKAVVQRCVPQILLKAVDLSKTLATEGGAAIQSADNSSITGQILKEGAFIFKAVEVAQKVFDDIVRSAWFLLAGLIVAVLTSFLWIVLLRFFTGCMVWFTLVGLLFVFVVGFIICFHRFYLVADKSFQTSNFEFQLTTDGWAEYLNYKEIWLALGCVAGLGVLIMLIIIICLRNRLRLAILLIGQASKAVGSMSTSLVFPIVPFFLELLCFAFWGLTTAFLASSSKPKYMPLNGTNGSSVSCDSSVSIDTAQCNFFKYSDENWSIYLTLFTLFVSIWILNFIIGLSQMTLAGAFASWYWAWEKPKDIPAFPLISSFYRVIRYHMGSVVFGSFLIAVVQFIRIILEYIDYKVKGSENPCAKFMICCLKCCFYCLEKCLKFITKNAYIMIAIYGKNFCFSAKDAFFMIMRNILRSTVLNGVASFVMITGIAIVTGAVTTFAFFFFSGQIPTLTQYTPVLNYFYGPVILIGLATIVVAKVFFDVFVFAVDTLFLCAMDDLERNDGTPEKPYFMSKEMMSLLDVKNQFKDSSKKEGCGLCCC